MWKVGMPNLGHTMEEGTVSAWFKPVGATVAKGEVIGTVETDKANFDIEAPGEGVLLEINVEAGRTVAVGTTIALVGLPGAAAVPSTNPTGGRENSASPAARKLAEELGIEIGAVSGTGEGGMVTRDDVRAAAAARGPVDRPEPGTGRRSMRRAIAEAMETSWQTIPQVALNRRVDVSASLGEGVPVTPAVIRALARALAGHRRFNAWHLAGAVEVRDSIDIAVAVTVPEGLLMPVLRNADRKTSAELGIELAALAAAARAGTLQGTAMIDASCSLSSLGRWGVETFTPIIYPPQVAILGVGKIDEVARPISGGVRFVPELSLSLVFDHRANDGVAAAEFLAAIAEYLTRPES